MLVSTVSNVHTANTHVFPVPDFAWHTKSKIEIETEENTMKIEANAKLFSDINN